MRFIYFFHQLMRISFLSVFVFFKNKKTPQVKVAAVSLRLRQSDRSPQHAASLLLPSSSNSSHSSLLPSSWDEDPPHRHDQLRQSTPPGWDRCGGERRMRSGGPWGDGCGGSASRDDRPCSSWSRAHSTVSRTWGKVFPRKADPPTTDVVCRTKRVESSVRFIRNHRFLLGSFVF